MKRTITLSAVGLAAAALLTGCSGGTPAAQAPGAATSGGGTTSSTAPAPATSSTIAKTDTVTLIKQMTAGQKNLKYYTANTESTTKMEGYSSTSKSVTLVDNTNPDKPKMQTTSDSTTNMGTGTPHKSQTVTVIDGEIIYTKEPDGSWSKNDVSRYKSPTASASPSANPDEFAQKVADLIKEPTLVGEETVNGVPTKHYRFSLDMSQLFGSATGGSSASAKASASSSVDASTNDYWLNADGVPVKTSTTSKYGTSTTVLSKLNEPLKIDVPTNATVKPMPTYPGMTTTKK